MIPEDYVFDVVSAARSLAKLAEAEPDAQIALTVAQITPDGGMEEEAEIVMPVAQAAAMVATAGADQRVPGVTQPLYLLRVSRQQSNLHSGFA